MGVDLNRPSIDGEVTEFRYQSDRTRYGESVPPNQFRISSAVGIRPAILSTPSTAMAGVSRTPALAIATGSSSFSTETSDPHSPTTWRTTSSVCLHLTHPAP